MPAIASLEDLKAAQKEGFGIYALLYACPPVGRRSALCCMRMAQDRFEECVWSPRGKGSSHPKAERGRHPGQELVVFCCRGKLWLEERSLERLKGESE
jgi:hypothetical protein